MTPRGNRHPHIPLPIVRMLEHSDVDRVAELEVVCFPLDPWSAKSFHETIDNPNAICLIALEGDHLTGYLVSYSFSGEGHLLNIAVDPKDRGKGFGKRLLEEWFDLGSKANWQVAYLEVRVSNKPAIHLYERYGFEPVGVRPKYYSNGEDALLMTRWLNR